MSWYKVDEKNPASVHVDADAYMPKAMAEIKRFDAGIPEAVLREVARQWRHWDLNVQLRADGKQLPEGVMVHHVHGDKAKWSVSAAPPPKDYPPTGTVEFSRKVGGLARELYKKARGYAPA